MIDKGRSDDWKELIKKDYLFNYTPLGIIESLISTKFPLLSHIPHPFLTVSFHMVKRFDHSLTNIRKNIFDRSYRIKRQSLSRKFIVTHIPLHISRPNLSLPSTCHPLPHCATRTDNNEDAFYPEGGRKKKRKREIHSRRGDLRVRNNETRRIYRKRRCCSILVTTARRAPPFLFFFLSFFLFLSSFFLFFPPQHPCSLWGTHYRCSFHVISESHSRHLGRLYKRDDYRSVVEPGFFLPFLFFHPLFISRFATYQNPFAILIRQILIRYWINVHNESFFFLILLFIFIYGFLYLRAKRGWGEGNIIFAKIEFFLEIFFVIGYETCHGPYLSARTSANIRSLAD